MSLDSIRFILYSRSYCHLCDDMLSALQRLPEASSVPIEVVDVDADEQLVARYDELVPVLLGIRNGHAVELCNYFLDDSKVREFLTPIHL